MPGIGKPRGRRLAQRIQATDQRVSDGAACARAAEYLNEGFGGPSYGNCRINATTTRNVWWVRFYNSQDTLILNSIEVCPIPSVALAAAEDIADSRERLSEILEAYR